MNHQITLLALAVATALSPTGSATAQWSADPGANLVLSDRSGEQVQPKVVATSDGGAYVSWFDNADGGYDVYLQRLSAGGVEQWAHNGILVADRGFSSTQDYGLAVDTAGNALLAFRDDSGAIVQISANRVSPAGTLLWGAGGVQLTATTDFVAAPKIIGAADGNVVVAWTQDVDVVAQKLNPSGAPLWGAGVTLSPSGNSLTASDLRAADSGEVIVSMVHSVSSGGPRHLWAQKLATADGAPLWGATPLPVYDPAGGSLQFGNFPDFVADGERRRGLLLVHLVAQPPVPRPARRRHRRGALRPQRRRGLDRRPRGCGCRRPSPSHPASRGDLPVLGGDATAPRASSGSTGRSSTPPARASGPTPARSWCRSGDSQPSFVQNQALGGRRPRRLDRQPRLRQRPDPGNPGRHRRRLRLVSAADRPRDGRHQLLAAGGHARDLGVRHLRLVRRRHRRRRHPGAEPQRRRHAGNHDDLRRRLRVRRHLGVVVRRALAQDRVDSDGVDSDGVDSAGSAG